MTTDANQLKHKKSKVRSAWISFLGRIVAQLVGAVASVTLGLVVLTRYGFPEKTAPKPAAAVTAEAPVTQRAQPAALRPAGELALAVLPVQNYSKDSAQGFLADGVTEALTAELAQIAGLRVTSRTSAMAYKGTTKSLPVIARELGVDLILEGSVVRDAQRVRMTAQLIDAVADQHLWARSYVRPMRGVLPLQSEVVGSVVQEIGVALRPWLGTPAARQALVNARISR